MINRLGNDKPIRSVAISSSFILFQLFCLAMPLFLDNQNTSEASTQPAMLLKWWEVS